MKITSVICRNKMVSCPHGVFVLDDRQYVRPALPFPPKNVLLSDVGDKVGEAAFSAAMTTLCPGIINQIHGFLWREEDIHIYKDLQ